MNPAEEWIWGRHPVLEALRAGRVVTVLLSRSIRPSPVVDDIERAAAQGGVVVRRVDAERLVQISGGENAQGVAAQTAVGRKWDVGSILETARRASGLPFLLALDEIQDPHNVGALLRSADAVGVHGVIMPHRRSAALGGTVAKVSAGASQHVPVAEVTNLARALARLKEEGLWIVGLDGAARQAIYDADLRVPLALVVGGEQKGLRRLTREVCDLEVKLPMLGQLESLNASVAGSVAMYEVVRQRMTLG